MPWPLMVLDWARHQLPRPGARCIYASRQASTLQVSVGGLLSVTPIRRETSKACTCLTRGPDGARMRQLTGCG